MYRAIPEGNKLLSRRWREKEREIHHQKLMAMKPSVEIREPATFAHLQKKLKKNQMQEGKYAFSYINVSREVHGDREREQNPPREDDSHYATTLASVDYLTTWGSRWCSNELFSS